jgi:hypothetical protein
MIKRAIDRDEIDYYVNHPEILEDMGYSGDVLDTDAVVSEDNYFLIGKGCLFIFVPLGDSVYDGHSGAIRDVRGKNVVQDGKNAIEYMFNETDCVQISGYTPLENIAARKFNVKVGFKSMSKDDGFEHFVLNKGGA